ncbi:Protein of unknown function [Tranquillimonas rosea]|uniref:DUF2852 domain-containing protein n=1 Tax=Tranquillimonas rosea TaxID=641238 RepID=A0A1H9TN50_9RHOB|nr:DUF2852 domain-containing protein [Tranquillimonas rosea]SER98551.1 Protein of unknown function [Tranquillimonas rosea]
MSTTADVPHLTRQNWLAKSEAWLDDRGKGAWIALMVLGFIAFWPIGLALLAYMIWSKRMFTGSCRKARHRTHVSRAFTPTGNAAFDAYRTETLRRLEEEQEAFQSFLERLRAAKDKAEFDQFMDERGKRSGNGDAVDHPAGA